MSKNKDTKMELVKPPERYIRALHEAKSAAAAASVEAVSKLVDLMRNSDSDKIQLEAAKAIIERGMGRTREEIDVKPTQVVDVTDAEIERILNEPEPGGTQ